MKFVSSKHAFALGFFAAISLPSSAFADAGFFPDFSSRQGPCGGKQAGERCDGTFERQRTCVEHTFTLGSDEDHGQYFRPYSDPCTMKIYESEKIVTCLRCERTAKEKK